MTEVTSEEKQLPIDSLNNAENRLIDGTIISKENHEILKQLCADNAEYFAKDSSENGQRLYLSFLAIIDNIDIVWPIALKIQKVAANYDFDENTPGNGYRSFLSVLDLAVIHGIQLCKKVCLKRDSVLFRKATITKEMECCSQLIISLGVCFNHLETFISWSLPNELFPKEERSLEEQLIKSQTVNKNCFYGRSLGFQYCESIKASMTFVAIAMAIFSEAYYSQGSLFSKATNSLLSSTKYITDPEQRAKRVVNISQNADIHFCKAFWFLAENELMSQVPNFVKNNISISKIISLPSEPFTLVVNGKEINVPVPTSHIGVKPIQLRLISNEIREGMIGEGNQKGSNILPPSRGLLIHCHGGGFVAQSSKSHESYLRDWAKELKIPILCIDYSLAPEAPFPRAQEEVLYAYCWALKNHHLLGSTGERIVAAGDSAGANILLTSALKCLELGVPVPDGIFVAYVPVFVNFDPSPSRFLCIMDPLLPLGFLLRCLKAYAIPNLNDIRQNGVKIGGNTSDTESFEEISESDLVELQAHKSPVSETSDTLTYDSLTSQTEDCKEQEPVKEKCNATEIDLNTSDVEQSSSQKYVAEFIEKYVLDTDTEPDGIKIPVLRHETSTSSSNFFQTSLSTRIVSFVSNLRTRFHNLIPKKSPSGAAKMLDVDKDKTVLEELNFTVPKNPFLTPYFANDDVLKKLPPIKILTVHLDPCLDDCVMFARKLKRLGNDVGLDILTGLPHGFLNFSLFSKEAQDGSKLCVQRISELLNLDNLPSQLPKENGLVK